MEDFFPHLLLLLETDLKNNTAEISKAEKILWNIFHLLVTKKPPALNFYNKL